MYRSDWPRVAHFDYSETPQIINSINGNGPIETDAQFAKYIYDNLGAGEYVVWAWCKGRKGTWCFLHLVCFDNGYFKRVCSEMTVEEKEFNLNKREYVKVQRKMRESESDEERQEIQEEEQELLDEMGTTKEMIEVEKETTRRGPGVYLKTTRPLYSEHQYEEFMVAEEQEQQPRNEMT